MENFSLKDYNLIGHMEKKTRKWEVSLIVDNATVPSLIPELAQALLN